MSLLAYWMFMEWTLIMGFIIIRLPWQNSSMILMRKKIMAKKSVTLIRSCNNQNDEEENEQ